MAPTGTNPHSLATRFGNFHMCRSSLVTGVALLITVRQQLLEEISEGLNKISDSVIDLQKEVESLAGVAL